uniref:ER membrane protein complex subunit 2 n=1 Tax=Ascaris lumbricoides TaxID=6252 RepID=A0A9J2P882_ASCLU
MDATGSGFSHISRSPTSTSRKYRPADVARERAEIAELNDWTSVSFEDDYVDAPEARSVLRQWREEHVRRSEEAVELWEYVLSRYPRSLGDELWLIYEQICIAALDCARIDVAVECIKALQEKFPRSNRVLKLQAMRLEALQRYESALLMYEQLIESDPTNMSYRKRRIALLKVQGERQEAIKEMIEYLKTFLNDSEAWLELSQLYLHEGDYPRAVHCFEELLLANPHNSLYLRRLAEIRYAQGGQENVELAKVYFEHAIRTNPSCTRSLFGLLVSCNWLAQKTSGQRKREYAQSGLTAADKLLQRYRDADHDGSNASTECQVEVLLTMKNALQS